MVSIFPRDRWVIVFNATFNNILDISWRSVLLVPEAGGPRDHNRPTASHSQTVSHNVVSSAPRNEQDSNSQHWWSQGLIAYQTITATTAPYTLIRMD